MLFVSMLKLVSNIRQLFAADNLKRGLFQMRFFGTLRVNPSKFIQEIQDIFKDYNFTVNSLPIG